MNNTIAPVLFLLLSTLAVLSTGAQRTEHAQASSQSTNQDQTPDLFDDSVIRDLHFVFDDANWESRLQRLGEDEYAFADLEVDGVTYDSVGLRIKGNSSARGSGRKVPLNLTLDATVDGQDLAGYDTLNLNSGFMSPLSRARS